MSTIDEGYTKFECEWIVAPAPDDPVVTAIAEVRDRLHDAGLIGVYPDGIGFGNLSARAGSARREIIITGTQTGAVDRITPAQMTRIVSYDIDRNRLTCVGPVAASSESLTHAAIYECDEHIGAVIHVHSLEAWERLKGIIPTTDERVAYGTPEMARAIRRLYERTDLSRIGVAAMAGHREGIIALGSTLHETERSLLAVLGPER